MGTRLIALAGGMLAIALIAVGCGGGSDNEVSTSSLSKAEFVKKADAVCTKGGKQVESQFGAYLKKNAVNEKKESEAETEARATEIVETILLPAIRGEIDEIRALGAPSGDEDQVEAILEALEESVERSEADPVTALKTNVEIFAKPKGLAEEFGLKVCGY